MTRKYIIVSGFILVILFIFSGKMQERIVVEGGKIPHFIRKRGYRFYDVFYLRGDSLREWIVGEDRKNHRGVVFRTSDGGGHWEAKYSDEFVNKRYGVTAFYCVKFADERIGYIGCDRGMVIKTTDGGENWFVSIGWGVVIDENTRIVDIYIDERYPFGLIVWAISSDGSIVARSTDGGIKWIYHHQKPEYLQDEMITSKFRMWRVKQE